MVPVIGNVVALVPVKAGMLPVPLAPKPIAVLLLSSYTLLLQLDW